VNRGGLCIKGASAAELLGHPERLTTPLVRDARTDPFRPTTWDDALDRIAAAIIATQQRYGRDAVGALGGGGLTNEKAYHFGKFVRVALRSRHIDYNGRFCMSSAVAAGTRAFGMDRGLPFPFDDIPKADVVVLVGSNPADTMPPAMRFFADGRARGARHVVVDPRRTATAESPTPTCSPCRTPTSRWPTGCSTSRSGRTSSTRRTSPPGPVDSTPCAEPSGRTGRTGSSA
jgi:assimilatory nitrate reductase catalytic subunit